MEGNPRMRVSIACLPACLCVSVCVTLCYLNFPSITITIVAVYCDLRLLALYVSDLRSREYLHNVPHESHSPSIILSRSRPLTQGFPNLPSHNPHTSHPSLRSLKAMAYCLTRPDNPSPPPSRRTPHNSTRPRRKTIREKTPRTFQNSPGKHRHQQSKQTKQTNPHCTLAREGKPTHPFTQKETKRICKVGT
ncbi:hypothetical protein BU24DRAFT_254402 [Aaosphaeria arxii CBS 175.79]|uniref:Uncharacterized protein n=1 Tax=Aaosphaeria arxii CBS 175.79 TaxID=1450172 RepID=A0A6A5XJS6_9PLEO|nr:uncharacterized protein BU24DRAFT_254402 [Aaosphaeria arxii CBS 175.79]KAF2012564.1 hypothetical protein BU24DRAFT_254402 [Aaosphaeria arxii CBS 175.79]